MLYRSLIANRILPARSDRIFPFLSARRIGDAARGSNRCVDPLRDHWAALQNGGVVMPNKVHIARAVMMGVAIRSLGMYKNLGVWSAKSSSSCCWQAEGSCAWALPTNSNLVLPMCTHQLYKSYGEYIEEHPLQMTTRKLMIMSLFITLFSFCGL